MIFQMTAATKQSWSKANWGVMAHSVTVLSVLVLACAGVTRAQDLEPRAYVETPVGMNFLIAGYAYSEGGVSTDPSVPIEGADLKENTFVFAYARSLNVFGTSGKIDFIFPFSQLSGSALLAGQPVEREVTGFADPRFRFSVNLYGAPALSMKEYQSYRQNIIIGASMQISVPASQYDSSKVVNIGTNRWAFRPGLGISKALGKIKLELSADVTFYTNNDDFFGGHTLEQDPMYSVQAHVSYDFGRGMWGAVDGTYYLGGRTTIDGRHENNMQENSRVGATFALPVNKTTRSNYTSAPDYQPERGVTSLRVGLPGSIVGAVGYDDASYS